MDAATLQMPKKETEGVTEVPKIGSIVETRA